jgi:hypothetical protein
MTEADQKRSFASWKLDWIDALLVGLDHREFRVAVCMLQFAGPDRLIFPSQERMALLLGCERKVVARAIGRMVKEGWIESRRRARHLPNAYQFVDAKRDEMALERGRRNDQFEAWRWGSVVPDLVQPDVPDVVQPEPAGHRSDVPLMAASEPKVVQPDVPDVGRNLPIESPKVIPLKGTPRGGAREPSVQKVVTEAVQTLIKGTALDHYSYLNNLTDLEPAEQLATVQRDLQRLTPRPVKIGVGK